MKFIRQSLFITAITAGADIAVAQTASPDSGASAATIREDARSSTVLAGNAVNRIGIILSIDRERRDLVLGTDEGERLSVRLGENIRNFDSLKEGDRISVTFGEAIAVAPAQHGADAPRLEGTRTVQPAESQRALIRKVERNAMMAKVEKVDRNGNTATLRSPGGGTFVVSLEGQEHLPPMKEGSEIAVVHVETMALTEAPGGGAGSAANASGQPVERLQKAAERLREAMQTVATTSGGEDREKAIQRAQEALSQAQEAIALAASSSR